MWLNKMLNKNLKTLIWITFHLTIIYPSNYITDNTFLTSNLLRRSVKESIFFPVYVMECLSTNNFYFLFLILYGFCFCFYFYFRQWKGT